MKSRSQIERKMSRLYRSWDEFIQEQLQGKTVCELETLEALRDVWKRTREEHANKRHRSGESSLDTDGMAQIEVKPGRTEPKTPLSLGTVQRRHFSSGKDMAAPCARMVPKPVQKERYALQPVPVLLGKRDATWENNPLDNVRSGLQQERLLESTRLVHPYNMGRRNQLSGSVPSLLTRARPYVTPDRTQRRRADSSTNSTSNHPVRDKIKSDDIPTDRNMAGGTNETRTRTRTINNGGGNGMEAVLDQTTKLQQLADIAARLDKFEQDYPEDIKASEDELESDDEIDTLPI